MKTVTKLKRAAMSILMASAVLASGAQGYTYTNQADALNAARADVSNWMKYLPDNVFVAHLSVPGTHDTMTGHKWINNGTVSASISASQSTTQSALFSEQLAAGIRALDFRPGLMSGTVYCGHGGSLTEVTLDDAMKTLTDFIDAHPSEFFFIHLFRGNVYPTDSGDSDLSLSIKGCTKSASDVATYRNIIEGMFNGDGKYAKYIVDYNPMLTVEQMRGKIVLLRRDRIPFLELEKGGYISNWTMQYNPWNPSTVTNASNPRIKGTLHTQDVSSPYENKEDEDIEAEKTYCKALLKDCREQQRPNDVADKSKYIPFWSMNFTSGEAGTSGTNGYKNNATIMNPLTIADINDAAAEGKVGPTGIMFSDWVLNDTYSGNELITTILENNFKYIDEFRINPADFTVSFTSADDGIDHFGTQEYYLRNVGTGLFLQEGENWGTHAMVGTGYPARLKFEYDTQNGGYVIKTEYAGYYISTDSPYMDNYDNKTPWDVIATASGDAWTIQTGDTGLGVTNYDGERYAPGFVDNVAFSPNDHNFHWVAVPVSEMEATLANATAANPMDATFMVRGVNAVNIDVTQWNFTLGKSGNNKTEVQTGTDGGWNEKTAIMYIVTPKVSSWYGSATKWSCNYNESGYPNGVYDLEFDAITSYQDDLGIKVCGQSVTFNKSGDTNMTTQAVAALLDGGDYHHKVHFTITDGKLTFVMNKKNTNTSKTFTALKNFKLTYYGEEGKEIGDYTMHVDTPYSSDLEENHIAVNNDGDFAATSITIADHKAHHIPVDVNADQVNYNRPIAEALRGTGWHALYLPFEVDGWTNFATRVIEFTGVDESGENDILLFTDVEESAKLESHKLYLAQLEDNVELSVSNSWVYARPTEDTAVEHSSSTNKYTLVGNYDLKDDMWTSGAYALSGSEFMKAKSDAVVLKPFRAFLLIEPLGGAPTPPAKIALGIDHGTEGIEAIESDVEIDVYYNIKGQRIDNPANGLYIKGNKKVYINN